jgi:hypothetical protein
VTPVRPRWVVLGVLAAVLGGFLYGTLVEGGWRTGLAIAFYLSVGLGLAAGIFLWEQALHREYRSLAGRHGWSYREADAALPFRHAALPLFRRGDSRHAAHVLEGTAGGMPFLACTYRYTTGSGRTRRTHSHRVVEVPMPIDGPALTIAPERLRHKAWQAVGGADLDFESDGFSRRFWVKAEDRRLAYDTITPAMMEFLLERSGRWTWHWHGRSLLLVRRGRLRAREVLPALELAHAFRALLPRHRLAETPAAPSGR